MVMCAFGTAALVPCFSGVAVAAACARQRARMCEDATLHSWRRGGRRHENGDLLRFNVTVSTPPSRQLGRFKLDARTHCGDIIEHDGYFFVVKSVTLHYRYGNGGARVVRKSIEVTSLERRAVEMRLECALQADQT